MENQAHPEQQNNNRYSGTTSIPNALEFLENMGVLSNKEMHILARITTLSNRFIDNGGCTLSNERLARLHGCSTKTVTVAISKANRLGMQVGRKDIFTKTYTPENKTITSQIRKISIMVPWLWEYFGEVWAEFYHCGNEECEKFLNWVKEKLSGYANNEVEYPGDSWQPLFINDILESQWGSSFEAAIENNPALSEYKNLVVKGGTIQKGIVGGPIPKGIAGYTKTYSGGRGGLYQKVMLYILTKSIFTKKEILTNIHSHLPMESTSPAHPVGDGAPSDVTTGATTPCPPATRPLTILRKRTNYPEPPPQPIPATVPTAKAKPKPEPTPYAEQKKVGDRSIRYFPPELQQSKTFRKAWGEWLEYRKVKGHPIEDETKVGFKKQVERILTEIGTTPNVIKKAIDHSMANNWRGLFAPKEGFNNGNGYSNGNGQKRLRNAIYATPEEAAQYSKPKKGDMVVNPDGTVFTYQ